MRRVDGRAINKRVLEHLVKTGAFDYSHAPRKPLFDGIDAALAGAAAHARDKAAGQHSFLDMLADEKPKKAAAKKPPAKKAAFWSRRCTTMRCRSFGTGLKMLRLLQLERQRG